MHYGGASEVGAVYVTAQHNNLNCVNNGYWGGSYLTVNASKSNSIYGSSNTVTPLSKGTLYILKY